MEIYFQGGFLFGLGEELEKEGFSSLTYPNLIRIFQQEIKKEITMQGNEWVYNWANVNFFTDLVSTVQTARRRNGKNIKCEFLLK